MQGDIEDILCDMKAKLIATGETVEIDNLYSSIYIDKDGLEHSIEEFEFTHSGLTSEYWEKLKHRYAGQAMEAMLTNPELLEVVTEKKGLTKKEYAEKVACVADIYATALVEKLKEE